MVKQDRKYYVIGGNDSTSKFMSEVKNNPQKHCGKPTPIYPTNNDLLYMARLSERFDMVSGKNLGRKKNGATKIIQCLGPRKKNHIGQPSAGRNAIQTRRKTSQLFEYGL